MKPEGGTDLGVEFVQGLENEMLETTAGTRTGLARELPRLGVEVDVAPETVSELVEIELTCSDCKSGVDARFNGGEARLTVGINVHFSERLQGEAPSHLGGSKRDVSFFGGDSKAWVRVDFAGGENCQQSKRHKRRKRKKTYEMTVFTSSIVCLSLM